jgi:hypothetical protein
MRATVAGAGFLLLATLPGIGAAERFLPSLPAGERRAFGLALGFALFTVLAYAAALVGVLWLAALGATVATVVALVSRPRGGGDGFDGASRVALVLAFLWFAVPLLRRGVPQGWDPAFHTPIVELVRTLGHLPATWAPYEPAERFNYPAGLHALMAVFARASGLAADQVFTLTFVWLGALLLVLVHALGRRFGGGALAGTCAVLVYGLTDGWGTLSSHAAWGGLANLAGLVLMAGFVLALVGDGSAVVLAALLAAAMALVHHLSFLLLLSMVALVAGLEILTERRLSAVGRQAMLATAGALLTAGVVVLVRPAGRYDLAQGFRWEADRMVDLVKMIDVMGPTLLVVGGIGLCVTLRTHRAPGARLLPAWAVALLAFWVLFDVVYRALVYWGSGENYTAFTPARGLTDAAVPLAVAAGVLLRPWCDRLGPRRGPLCLGLALVALGVRGELARWQEGAGRAAPFAAAGSFCQQVRRSTPDDALIFALEAPAIRIWLPYLCAREFNYFPEPSYTMSPYRQMKASITDAAEFARQLAPTGRPLYQATTRAIAGAEPILAVAGWRLYGLGS